MASSKKVRGLLVEIGGDTTKLQTALKEVDKTTNKLSRELTGINTLLKFDPSNTTLLNQKAEVLSETLKETENRLDALQQAQQKLDDAGVDKHSADYRDLQREIISTTQKLTNLKNETSNFTKAGKDIEKVGTTIYNLGNTVDNVGNKVTTGLTLPIVALGAYSVKSSMDFESAFAGVRKTVDATEEEYNEFREGILEMSKVLPASAEEIAAVAEAAGQLGIQKSAILSFTRTMVDLGEASNMTSDEAATALARFANITQMDQSEFSNLGAVVTDLGNKLASTESEIVEMGLRLAGAGAQVGMTEDQILSFAGALSSVGIEAEAGGSAFSRVMVQMQLAVEKGNEQLEQFAQVSGMSAEQFKIAFKEDAAGAIIAFINGLSNLDGTGKSAIGVLDEMGLSEIRVRDTLLRASGAADLFNQSLEIGSKAWQENSALTKEANERYKTSESQLNMARNKAKALAITMGDELLPHINDLLDFLGDLAESFADMTDEEQQTILKTAALVAGLGPAIKIVGNLGKVLGTTTKGIGTFTQAIVLMKNGIGDAKGSAATLAKVLSSMASPVGVLTTAIVVLTTAGIALASQQSEEEKQLESLNTKIKEQAKARQELANERQKEVESSLREIDNVSVLVNELKTLVDTNGQVKSGYEERVGFILNELNSALGTEYQMVGNVIQQYDELINNIDLVIAKKQAEIILNSQQEAYEKAIEEEAEATKNLADAKETLTKKQQEYNKAQEELNNYLAEHGDDQDLQFQKEYQRLQGAVQNAKNASKEAQTIYDDASKVYEGIYNDITNYQTNSIRAQSGNLEEINKILADNNRMIEENGKQRKATFEETVAIDAAATQASVEEYKKRVKNADESEKQILEATIRGKQNVLNETISKLKSMTSATEENTPEVVNAWKNLANTSVGQYQATLATLPTDVRKAVINMTGVAYNNSEQLALAWATMAMTSEQDFKNNISKLSPDMQEQILKLVEIINNNGGNVTKKAKELAEDVVDELNKQDIAQVAGINLTKGFALGVGDKEAVAAAVNAATSMATKALENMRRALGEHSPSRKARLSGNNYTKGFALGILDEEKNAVKAAKTLSNNVLKELDYTNKLATGSIDANFNKQITDATKTIFTTPNIQFNVQTLNKENLDLAFNYINKKFGSQY